MRTKTNQIANQSKTTLPRGIRTFEVDRPSGFRVQWRDGSGSPKTKSFRTKAERDAFAGELALKREEQGRQILDVDLKEWAVWLRFKEAIGGADPFEVASFWRANGAGGVATVGFKDAARAFLAKKEAVWDAGTYDHNFRHAERAIEAFGDRSVGQIKAPEIEAWLKGIRGRGGELIGAWAQRGHLKTVRMILQDALPRGAHNEADLVDIRAPLDGDPEILTPQEAFNFFKANRDSPIIGRLALEAFGMLRTNTAARITSAGIRHDIRAIRMAAEIQKSGKKDGRARLRDKHPENLWEWIRHVPAESWDHVDRRSYDRLKTDCSIRAGLRPSTARNEAEAGQIRRLKNIWRHSAITYHAALGNVPLTQDLAQHAAMTETEGYRGLATEKEGRLYYAISPKTVLLSWEEFCTQSLCRHYAHSPT